MTRLLVMLATLALISGSLVAFNEATKKEPILEMVVYKIKPEGAAKIDELIKKNAEEMKKFPGYVSYKSTVSITDPLVRVDYCEWASAEDAAAAAEKVPTMPEFAEFYGLIAEVVYFGHHKPF